MLMRRPTARARRGGVAQQEFRIFDDTGLIVKFQMQTFEVARYCVRKRMGGEDAR